MVDSYLQGKRVLVTRASDQAGSLVSLLTERGARPVELPTIRTLPAHDYTALDDAIREVERYVWVIFTSVNGVRFVADRFTQNGHDLRRLNSAKVVAIGPATATALADLGVQVDLIPSRYLAEAVVDEMGRQDLVGQRILLPVARNARDVLPACLAERGAVVDRVVAYETVLAGDPKLVRILLAETDIVTFTSSSTVQNLIALLGNGAVAELSRVVTASIGPITSQTARDLGLTIQIEATVHSVPGLVDALDVGPTTLGLSVL